MDIINYFQRTGQLKWLNVKFKYCYEYRYKSANTVADLRRVFES